MSLNRKNKRVLPCSGFFVLHREVEKVRKYAEIIREAVLLLGCALITAGAAMLSVPAGLICGGVLLCAVTLADSYDEERNEDGGDASE